MYAQQSTKYSGLSLKESDPKFAGAATHIHNKDSSGCCLNSTTSVRSHSLQPQSSALHKRPDDWVLEVELCLPVPQIVHLHPAKTLHAHTMSAPAQSGICWFPGRTCISSCCIATVAKESTAEVCSAVAMCRDGALHLLAAQPILWPLKASEHC